MWVEKGRLIVAGRVKFRGRGYGIAAVAVMVKGQANQQLAVVVLHLLCQGVNSGVQRGRSGLNFDVPLGYGGVNFGA